MIWLISTSFPEILAMMLTSLLIETISSEPIFTGPVKSEIINRLVASMHSSINKKERVWLPSPHISITPPSIGSSATFLHMAAGTFSFPPLHVPSGPKTLWYLAIFTGIS